MYFSFYKFENNPPNKLDR